MPRILYITTDLPYFPGQAGVMALHLRHLSANQQVGVVGPRYPHQPEDALQSLRDTVSNSYWWPEHAETGEFPVPSVSSSGHRWFGWLPHAAKKSLLLWLCGLHYLSDDAIAWRRVLVNLAPKIMEALKSERWNTVLLSQSCSAGWLPFLPASLARCIYFHDIRSDYLKRAPSGFRRPDLARIRREEVLAATRVDSLAFVSEVDERLAHKLFQPVSPTGTAPLCIDLDYFSFRSPTTEGAPVVLFTGHLSHPPNVDAVLHFLRMIWPVIRAAVPTARVNIVGAQPAEAVVAAAKETGAELLANVPDIRPYFRKARVYVVPMRFGGGVRNKILEAWALGVPVVSTPMGAEGLGAEDGVNCWIRDVPEDFSAQVISVLRAPSPESLLIAARQEVENRHCSTVSSPRLARMLTTARLARQESAPKVLFDLRWLQPGKAGGIEQMLCRLVEELSRFDRTGEYRFFGSRQACRCLRLHPRLNHRVIHTDGLTSRFEQWRNGAITGLTDALREPALTSPELQALEGYTRLDFTVVHGIPSYVHPDLRRFPSVVTIHDLQHLHLPELFSAQDIATREFQYRESCRLAEHVICVSEFTRLDAHRRYGVPLEKMTTIWNLPPAQPNQDTPRERDRRTLAALKVSQPYLFYPAQPWLHKNHRMLLQAFEAALPTLPAKCRLVMTGQLIPPDHPAFNILQSSKLRDRIVHLGYRSPEEIATLYRNALALVFASRFEGFGMPVLEAMQHRCPVICGEHTSLPEVAGSAACYVNVSSVDDLAAGMVLIARDEALRRRLQEAGLANLRRFNRRDLAEKHRAIYASVHSAHFS